MKSAILVSEQPRIFELLTDALRDAPGAVISKDHVQVRRGGSVALLYEYPGDDWREPSVKGVDLSQFHAVMSECRDQSLVVDLFVSVAASHPSELLLLDSTETAWTAEKGRADALWL